MRHVNGPDREGLESQESPVLVLLPPLKHYVELVSVSLQKVGILRKNIARFIRFFPTFPP